MFKSFALCSAIVCSLGLAALAFKEQDLCLETVSDCYTAKKNVALIPDIIKRMNQIEKEIQTRKSKLKKGM